MTALRRRLRRLSLQGKLAFIGRLIRSDRFWRLARRFRPVLVMPAGTVWVSRHDDVVDVLRRDRDFGVPYLDHLEGLRSPFLLGLPRGEDYDRQLHALLGALRHEGLPPLVELSVREARRALDESDGEIDVVGELTERVLSISVGAILGTGRLTATDLAHSREIFHEVFVNSLEDERVTERATAAGGTLRAHIAAAVDERRAEAPDGGGRADVLSLLLAEGSLSDDELVNSLLGLLVGWATPVSRSMGLAVDTLLRAPDRVALARDAALRGGSDEVRSVMREALRFRPSAPALERRCLRETYIAGRKVARGHKVMALVGSAMMDEARVEEPRRFDPGRDGEANLHFGYDVHRCIGEHISMNQIGAIASVLLAERDVRRAGPLELEGPFPRKLLVRFGAPAG